MQQRQLRLGDTLDDYCPRERRLTNHAVVAMVGDEVKQTRCATCETEHEYKHARVPRQRPRNEPAALAAQMVAAPKRVVHGAPTPAAPPTDAPATLTDSGVALVPEPEPHVDVEGAAAPARVATAGGARTEPLVEGPVHRPLIRAQLPRLEGQPPATRPAPDFTIRQPTGRPNRFRPRHPRAAQPFQENRSNGNNANGNTHGNARGGPPRFSGGRPPMGGPRPGNRQGPGQKRSK